jgi:TonB family protein
MKILSIIFVLVFSFTVIGQTGASSTYRGRGNTSLEYVNAEHNFAFTPPLASKRNEALNKETKSIVSFLCVAADCKVNGIFSLFEVTPLPDVTMADAVNLFQKQWVLDNTAKNLIDGFKPEMNATVLSKKYAAYNGRPAQRIDYNFVDNNVSINGVFVGMFVVERQAFISFNIATPPSDSEEWIKLCEQAIRSFTILPLKKDSTVKPPRGGITTRISSLPDLYTDSNVSKPISGRVLNGAAVSLPKPPYPAAAQAVRASGAVGIQVTIDEEGNVISANAVSGHPLLQQASTAAARQAKFSPTIVDGQKVRVTGVIIYNFIAPTLPAQ